MASLTQELASFVVETTFDSLPQAVVHEAKRALLDSVGCALAGTQTDKGKISMNVSRRLGGATESSIIGSGDKVSCCAAAFANGELTHALGYESILFPPGHVTPYVVPSTLAIAESSGASGRAVIIATVLGYEISARVSQALSGVVELDRQETGKVSFRMPPVSGYSQCVFGAAAGASKILGLTTEETTHAFGIAGYFCPVPTVRKLFDTAPISMATYGSGGWISTAGLMAALLAEQGYVGDTTVFDGPYGFWRFFASEKWQPEVIMERIGEAWRFLQIQYKPYPCRGGLHGALDGFISILDENDLKPHEIESVRVFGHPMDDTPAAKTEVRSHVDAQFSSAYIFAVAAHRVKVGADWQDPDTMQDPKILDFMRKVSCQSYPGYAESLQRGAPFPGAVEVVARGKTFRKEQIGGKGVFSDARPTDEDLAEKFRHNARRILTSEKTEKAIQLLLGLEAVDDISELMKLVTLSSRQI